MRIPSFVAMDFETANKDKRSACALSLVKFSTDGRVMEKYYTLLKPYYDCDEFIFTDLHGIDEYDVRDAPEWEDVFDFVNYFVDDLPLVAHNMEFDKEVMDDVSVAYGVPMIVNETYCTYELSQRHIHTTENRRLPSIYKYFFPGETFEHHQALDDAVACGEIFHRMKDRGWVKDHESLKFSSGGSLRREPRVEVIPSVTPQYTEDLTYSYFNKHETIEKKKFDTEYDMVHAYGFPEFLKDKTICFTGSFSSVRRDPLMKFVELSNGKASRSLTKSTDYLVVGKIDPSSLAEGKTKTIKVYRAEEYGVPIITESEFLKLISKKKSS